MSDPSGRQRLAETRWPNKDRRPGGRDSASQQAIPLFPLYDDRLDFVQQRRWEQRRLDPLDIVEDLDQRQL